jgi:hypothetical protein
MKQKSFSNLLLICAACAMAPLGSNAAAPGGTAAIGTAAAKPIDWKQFSQVEDLYKEILIALGQKKTSLKTVKMAMCLLSKQTRDVTFKAIEGRAQSQQPSSQQKDLPQALKNIHGLVCQYNEQNNPVDLNLVDPGINKTFLPNQTIDAKIKEFKQHLDAVSSTGNAQSKKKLIGITADMLLLILEIESNPNLKRYAKKMNLVKNMHAAAKIFLELPTMLSASAGNPNPAPPAVVTPPTPSPAPIPSPAAVTPPPNPSSSSSTRTKENKKQRRRTRNHRKLLKKIMGKKYRKLWKKIMERKYKKNRRNHKNLRRKIMRRKNKR